MRLSDLPIIEFLFFAIGALAVIVANRKLKKEEHEKLWIYVLLGGSIVCLISAVLAWF